MWKIIKQPKVRGAPKNNLLVPMVWPRESVLLVGLRHLQTCFAKGAPLMVHFCALLTLPPSQEPVCCQSLPLHMKSGSGREHLMPQDQAVQLDFGYLYNTGIFLTIENIAQICPVHKNLTNSNPISWLLNFSTVMNASINIATKLLHVHLQPAHRCRSQFGFTRSTCL